jgi:hypothetical protein
MKTSDKVILYLAKSSMTKLILSKELGISRPTLDQRLKDNTFLVGEIMTLQRLGVI